MQDFLSSEIEKVRNFLTKDGFCVSLAFNVVIISKNGFKKGWFYESKEDLLIKLVSANNDYYRSLVDEFWLAL